VQKDILKEANAVGDCQKYEKLGEEIVNLGEESESE